MARVHALSMMHALDLVDQRLSVAVALNEAGRILSVVVTQARLQLARLQLARLHSEVNL